MRVLYVLLLLICGTTISYAQDWVNYTSDSLHFSVESPKNLVFKQNVAMTDIGNLAMYSFGYKPKEKASNLLYQIIITQYPDQFMEDDTTGIKEYLIPSLIEESAELEGSELIYQDQIFRHSLPVYQWVIHNQGKVSIKSQAFIYKDRVYILQVMSSLNKALNEDIDRFFESFRLRQE